MGILAQRTLTDGLLDTRGHKFRCFAENLVGAAALPALLIAVTLFLGGGAPVAIFYGTVGALFVLGVATNVRTLRGAVIGGFVVALLLLGVAVTIHVLLSNPDFPL